MRRVPATGLAATACGLTLVVLAGCGASKNVIVDGGPAPTPTCSPVGAGVTIDYATSEGGAATPVLAAERFARHGGAQDLKPPWTGWSLAGGGTQVGSAGPTILRNSNWRLEATQGSDRGWLITGVRCVKP